MSLDKNKILENVLNLLKAIFVPSLAKALSVPLLLAGLTILSPPIWMELVNWLLANQSYYPEWQETISEQSSVSGWTLIGLSIFIFLVDIWKVIKTNKPIDHETILEEIDKQPQKAADLVIKEVSKLPSSATHIIDEKIRNRIEELKSLRFFETYPKDEKSIQLATDIMEGELFGGSAPIKALGLALVARYLSSGHHLEKAKICIAESKKLVVVPEANTAEAFVLAADSNVTDALSILAHEKSETGYASIFMLRRNTDGPNAAIDWLTNSGLSIQNLDVDGQISYLSALLEVEKWDLALDVADEFLESQISSTALAQLIAFVYLTNSVKVESLRKSVIKSIPFAAEQFPFADDSQSVGMRAKAIEYFLKCVELANSMKAVEISNVCERYVLWLELRNPKTHESAKNRLIRCFRNPDDAIEHLPLAFAFRIEVDYERIEEEVNKQTALSNGEKPSLGVARFVLAHKQNSYAGAVEYIKKYGPQIEKFISTLTVKMFEIEVLAKAGLVGDAECLLHKLEAILPAKEISTLSNLIAIVKGEDPIALSFEEYKKTNDVSELTHLVELLSKSDLKDKYLIHAEELFLITGTEQDAINVANAYSALGRFSELHQFLVEQRDIIERSEYLQFHWAWSLFRVGDLVSSKKLLNRLKKNYSERLDIELLEINIAIYSGEWESLTTLIEHRWENKEQLTAETLVQTAQLAKVLSPSRAKEILEYATSHFPEEPNVLASAYFTATSMGWEDDDNKADWLNKAAILSNEGGPIQTATFDELKEIMYSQKEQNEKVYKALDDGTAPIFIVSELLNKTLSDFFLIQPIYNKRSIDIRGKSLIPAFQSIRGVRVIESDEITIDVSSTLIIGYLGLLGFLFESFRKIVIPHSFMRWLYEEKQKISYHQPSQVAKANEFESLVIDGLISVSKASVIDNTELALKVGNDLALFLEEAKRTECVDNQVLVACSYPVFQIGSFREEQVALTEYEGNLISCSSVVKKLKELAAITDDECEKAIQYLRRHEEDWPQHISIRDDATIYLDSLSVTYLMTVGVLDKFHATNLKLFVHDSEHKRYGKLRSFDSTTKEAEAVLENIRSQFSSGICNGQVVLSEALTNSDKAKINREKDVAPLDELFQKSAMSGGLLIDDRFINQNGNIEVDGIEKPTYTTLDFISSLQKNGKISKEQQFGMLTKLREAGFSVIPSGIDEINHYLNKSHVRGGKLYPNKELKLIKQHLSLLKINRTIKLPRDANWLHSNLKILADVLKQQWAEDIAVEDCRARSNWLLGLIDFRSWSQNVDSRNEHGLAFFGDVIKISGLVIMPTMLNKERQEEYKFWLDEDVLKPLKESDLNSFNYLINNIKGHINNIEPKELSGDYDDE